ncbi:actin depolymerizing protein [Lophium mytilinum]|uniref:Twinfilin n=1 Tax=Lophium mytilinum TaxID=390894 RepID=A0A6A6R172_9PEZI|nr:actin depolymerizing protein [Lophium mytilinum]
MQSGISASAELLRAFQTFLTTPTQRGLLATISNESIQPGPTISSTNSSFLSDLSNLSPHLTPNGALYIILRRADSSSSAAPAAGSLVAVTYVPNAAPVRQKMLFASTRLTLLRELGSEHFGETVFVTEAEELSKEGWARHEAHGEAANPLTQEEQDLEGIKEQEAMESRGTQGKSLASGGSLAVKADEGVVGAVSALGQGGDNLVQLALDPKTEALTLVSTSTATASSISSAVDNSSPRFLFYRHDAATSNPILFISTCPSTSKIRERMLFAASRNVVIQFAQKEGGITIAKRLEVTNPDEITEKVIEEEVGESGKEEVPAVKSGFARPKRPGKR